MRLTLPQQDVYFEQLLHPGEPIYNIGAQIAIRGAISAGAMQLACRTLVNQHDALRSVVVQQEGEARVEFLPESDYRLDHADFSKSENPLEEAAVFLRSLFSKTFDLHSGDPLFRFVLVKVEEDFHYLLVVYHHLVGDGWSSSLVFRRMVKNYNELLEHGKVVTTYPFTYKDFLEDDLQYLQSPAFGEDRRYWKERFSELPGKLFEKIDKSVDTTAAGRKELVVPRGLYDRMESLAATLNCSSFHVILGVLCLYLGRRYGQTDLSIGLPVLNRGKASHKKTIGLFMGISVLRTAFSFEDSFAELVGSIKQQLRKDYRHQRFPLGKLVQELDAFSQRDQLFNLVLSYEKQEYADHFSGTHTIVDPLPAGAERVALSIHVRESDAVRDVRIDFDYNKNYFDEASIDLLAGHIEMLLLSVCAGPGLPLSAYDYLKPEEENVLLREFNDTAFEIPGDKTFLPLFREQVRRLPQKLALTDDERSYTYRQLEAASNRVAVFLAAQLPGGDAAPVAVLMPRSADLVAVLLGVLKSGRAFIPLDPGFPAERLNYIVAHSRTASVIGTSAYGSFFSDKPFIEAGSLLAAQEEPEIGELPEPSASAYIIYTSGSTGAPKGVEVGHRSLLNFLLAMVQKPGLQESDRFFSVTTQSFDISILEFFGPLISGGTVYMAARETVLDPPALMAKLEGINPTVIQATPSLYQVLVDAGWKGSSRLKLLCGGDVLTAALAEKLLRISGEAWNMYGPTETTIWSGAKKIAAPADASSIGTPIGNTQFYILDACRKPLPMGASGELYIGGEGVAKGYYREPALTEERFLDNPFRPGERFYRTGDLGKWNGRGEVEFLGRNDRQVKVMGYRMELGEIEAKLGSLPEVKAAVVVAKKTEAAAFLVAYVIPEEGSLQAPAVITALQKLLPEYMIPRIIIPLASFPLTPNGKIDRKLLSSQDVPAGNGQSAALLPASDLESAVCRIFAEALDIPGAVSSGDNFFLLGGNSISAMKVVSLVQRQLQYALSFPDLFRYPSARALAGHLSGLKHSNLNPVSTAPLKDSYPLTPAQYGIWLAAQKGRGRSAAYNMFAVYEVTGELDLARLETVLRNLVEKYEVLRGCFGDDKGAPYQKFLPAEAVPFRVDTFSVEASQVPRSVHEYVNREFDLPSGPLLRAGLFESGEKRLLALASHHIVMDGWSVSILVREIVRSYRQGIVSGSLSIRFRDYAYWLYENREDGKEAREKFWRDYLHGYSWNDGALPGKKTIPGEPAAGECLFTLEGAMFEKIKQAARRRNHTLHSFLATAFLVLLHKAWKKEDICIATVNAGRTVAGLHDQVGMFVKTLPLRSRLQEASTFSGMLDRTHEDMVKIDLHQDLPQEVSDELRLEVLFAFQPLAFNYLSLNLGHNATLKPFHVPREFSRLPLLVNIMEEENSLHCSWTFASDAYTKEEVEALGLKYEKLISQLVEDADSAIVNLDVELKLEEEADIGFDFNF